MYSITIEERFSATHQLRLAGGALEPRHGHDWRVRATFARAQLDDCGMVMDFALATRLLKEALAPLDYSDLNALEFLNGKNPTTEVIAQWVFRRLQEMGLDGLRRVEVTEAPGCVASYEE